MVKILNLLKTSLLFFLVLTFILGVAYPAIITGIAQIAFPKQANGSIITVNTDNGAPKAVGSALIAQEFTSPKYLIGRPLGVANLSPVSSEQAQLIKQRLAWWHAFDPDNKMPIPMDLVTTAGTAADPNISPDAAEYQVKRIARERNMTEAEVRTIINRYTAPRLMGFWGEPAVNVLQVNLALDGLI